MRNCIVTIPGTLFTNFSAEPVCQDTVQEGHVSMLSECTMAAPIQALASILIIKAIVVKSQRIKVTNSKEKTCGIHARKGGGDGKGAW